MEKTKIYKILLLFVIMLSLTGCTKILKNQNKEVVKNSETGQIITENIICKTNETDLTPYNENGIDTSKIPYCDKFNPLKNYEGLWTSIFVKPLAWVIIKIGAIVKNYGASLIITCLILRLILYPFTRKTAIQSELMKKAQPELAKLEKKYANKTSTEDQNKKAQEMMLIYQKYKVNPLAGCLIAFIQLPLLLAFYEAIQRTPAIFEDSMFGNGIFKIQLGTTPWVGIKAGHYIYLALVVLIFVATLFSFKKTLKDQAANPQMNMKYTLYFMLAIITYSSFTMASAVGIYWITSNVFTIIQNLLVERKKVN